MSPLAPILDPVEVTVLREEVRKRLHLAVAQRGGVAAQFARRGGVSEQLLWQAMRDEGFSSPRADTMAGLCLGNNVAPSWLLLGVGPIALDHVWRPCPVCVPRLEGVA
ncbi:hypothetical protein [Tropicimonas sp. S265A]|uniref:hypothetical protein n=1 Tax=Tropicimonas sp. S265A TaxID=3415134 RepID=UPI003C7E4A48